jgi:hypothetical protein
VTASGGERVTLVEAVMPFLDDWQALLKNIRALTPERVNAMLDRAEKLREQADLAGQGGIVHHLEVCIECLRVPALDRRGFQEALRNLSEVTWQLKQEVGPALRRSPAPAEGPRSMAQPPLLMDREPALDRGQAPDAARSPGGAPPLVSASGVQPPPPISLPGAVLGFHAPPNVSLNASPQRPPLDVSAPGLGPSREASAGPPRILEQRPAPAPAGRPFTPAGPSIIPGAGGRPSGAAPPAPQILGSRGNAPAARGKDKPNLMVATMFGLRAFGRGKNPSAAPPAPLPGPAPQALPRGGVLGLGKRPSGDPSGAPAWVGPRVGGLPELATGGPSPARGGSDDIDQRLRRLRGQEDSEERNERRGSGRPPTLPPKADRARSGGRRSSRGAPETSDAGRGEVRPREAAFPIPWWIGGVAVALVGLVVVGLLVFGRSSPQAAVLQTTPQGSGVETELPTSRLLDDKERMRALISLVHDYGGEESPELANLLNEEAAIVYEVIEQSCDQPGNKCERSAPMVAGTVRSGATPRHEIKHLFEDRKIAGSRRSTGQVPKWLAGLQTPAIGVEDDPNVKRLVEYYTENQVGREEFRNMLFRCGAYQDLIEKTLVHNGMPRALLALVMTESQCVPYAESPVGARGLWQFMPATARAYHLHVTENVVDERISPPKSTEAAVKFLADLYRKMGSWEFALASYNMGPFGLSARIKRAGGDVTFWDLANSGALPEETAKYVPRIQAYALILENLARFNFGAAQMRATEVTAELEAPPGTRLGTVARAASTSIDHLKLLNPDIVGMVVPDLPGSRFSVQVPKEDVFRARTVLEQLLGAGNQDDRCVSNAFDWGSEPFNERMCGGGGGKSRK